MVCLGNICRSPIAEGILKHKFSQHGIGLEVDSAGTLAYHAGERPDFRARQITKQHGINISDQVSRLFVPEDFDRFDRIYAMDMPNYHSLKAKARNEEDKAKVELILNRLYPGENRQVPDPYYGMDDGFQHVYDLLDAACDEIVKDYTDR